ncbi:FtsW/RodA/SpoVE family cell cycle protein [Falsibacillus pallidus]|uniref:FtsW/RodA/SpoVE family cell cycle protein n=1 Tax=Falsibacillus pallidus TaxID=493781 RepID=UPI003D956491
MSQLKEKFLAEVMQFIKSKEAKQVVYKELNYHLKQSEQELLSKGTDQSEAEKSAVQKMGSPSELGTRFNKLYRPLFDWKLFGLFLIVITMSLLPLVNIQENYAENFMLKQSCSIVLGIITTIGIMLIDYRRIKNWSWLFLIVALVLLIALSFFPNVVVNGQGYLHFASFTIAGEATFPLFLVFWAYFFSKEKPNLLLGFAVYFVSVLLFMKIPSIADVFIYSVLVLTLFVTSSIRKKTIYTTIGIAAGVVLTYVILFFTTMKEEQRNRLLVYLNPEKYADSEGYQYVALKDLLHSGGWFGNEETPKFMVNMWTDFAFANITYFFGWILAGALIVQLTMLVIRLIMVSGKVKDIFGKQLIIGVCALLSIQMIYNVGMIFGFLPLVSISLPFISYGVTATVLNSLLIGIVLSVYRRKNLITEPS